MLFETCLLFRDVKYKNVIQVSSQASGRSWGREIQRLLI
ncbi:unnamed protein product [Acanthoscelides obtectus]|uniref:Uncharacterized protein n=1 Tax=Acanthoscelides obtectus TaxID=200917 RepID=A0A9P0LQL4_ACAOB|nr:unnamed protein product [Acanthoscelides obtectus]CAK1627173.1 hypothetical protein AOBTE_LOCUS4356 [Acanthoscelides obtectus]